MSSKWPKTFPHLTHEQKKNCDDFMETWLRILPKHRLFRLMESFNHKYGIKHTSKDFLSTLDVGAGLGEHLKYEKLTKKQLKNYVALELREDMAATIKQNYPDVQITIGDCQEPISYPDNYFDRIITIHVLEHLPNLPNAVKELHRLCNKERGELSIVIPCEGGLLYSVARKISAERLFKKQYKQPYKTFIEREHVNVPLEILEELARYFKIQHKQFFPFRIPLIDLNLCIGLTLTPR